MAQAVGSRLSGAAIMEQSTSIRPSSQAVVARAIEVAASLFAERGYDATATRDISRALGITNGTFYHYFPSKEMLLVQICRESILRMTESVSTALSGLRISRKKLITLIEAHHMARVENRALRIVMLTERRALGPDKAKEINELAGEYRAIIEGVIREGQDAGLVRTDVSAEALTLALLNLMNYPIIRSNNEHSRDIETVEEAIDQARTLGMIFLEGAAPR